MERHKWKDGGVAWAEFSEDHELTVAFSGGNVYCFNGVPRKFFTELTKAQNPARYVRSHLKLRFDFKRLAA